ncbi:class E sortase [Streptomyces sp. NPDC058914]|uniref:class E sortase n=1 Tax=Streptomyces sp. NPDC058914 TaxID=3346671 RepID=UPI0036991E27
MTALRPEREDLYGGTPYEPPLDEETVALRIPQPPGSAFGGASISASDGPTASPAPGPPVGGRAARRKAAKRRHGRRGGAPETTPSAEAGARPLSRVEARRQARARKPSPAVVASRAVGEVFITTGVLMLLFVTYQLWWTNVRAHAQADKEASSLQDDWANGKRNPGTFSPGQGFAILHIPKLDVVVPIAEGISNKKVLDKGMVGHYAEGALKTAMPDAKTGNFGLAGHRNTHGEPFRYINRLQPGDAIVVETQDEYYVYKMASMLPVTSPSNVSVLEPVPPDSGFTGPGRYITLTTCTPEFTSKYRLIVWGKMVEERPRSKGKPDALVE